MSRAARVDAAALPRGVQDRRSPLWWGILGVVAVELTVVATLVASYFYLRMGRPGWPPAGTAPLPPLPETLNLVLLFAAAGCVGWAERQIERDRTARLSAGLLAAVLLAVLVLAVRWRHLASLPLRWDDHAYGSLVWTLTGFHFMHLVSAVLVTSALACLALRGRWSARRRLPLVVDRLYWRFVAIAWVPLYLTLYWSEHLL